MVEYISILVIPIILGMAGWYCYQWGYADGSAAGYASGYNEGIRERP